MNAILRSSGDRYADPLSDQRGLSALSTTYLQLWADGEAGRDRMICEIHNALGPQRGQRIITLWTEFLEIYRCYQLDAAMPHAIYDAYLGIDETSFAKFLVSAVEGEREEALLLALSLVRPDAVLILTNMATQIGLSLKQILLIRSQTDTPLSPRLH